MDWGRARTCGPCLMLIKTLAEEGEEQEKSDEIGGLADSASPSWLSGW